MKLGQNAAWKVENTPHYDYTMFKIGKNRPFCPASRFIFQDKKKGRLCNPLGLVIP